MAHKKYTLRDLNKGELLQIMERLPLAKVITERTIRGILAARYVKQSQVLEKHIARLSALRKQTTARGKYMQLTAQYLSRCKRWELLQEKMMALQEDEDEHTAKTEDDGEDRLAAGRQTSGRVEPAQGGLDTHTPQAPAQCRGETTENTAHRDHPDDGRER